MGGGNGKRINERRFLMVREEHEILLNLVLQRPHTEEKGTMTLIALQEKQQLRPGKNDHQARKKSRAEFQRDMTYVLFS